MSSGPGQNPAPSKAVNIQNSSVSTPQSQTHSSGPEGSSQRRPSGNLVGGSSSKNLSSPRNNQSRKSQHKRHRRPRLADEDAMAESTAMKSTTSRKGQTSITHLMNFSLPPRPQHHHHHPFHRPHRRNLPWGVGSGHLAVDKARYVHANYRFIVNPKNNYHAQATNADVHLDWDAVLHVLASSSTQAASCPICLSVPVAPRIAKCGHIFCLPCLIRFMHSAGEHHLFPERKAKSKKCPICWDTVYISETRCVRWYSGQQVDALMEGGDVFLRLVLRKPQSTLALPRDGIGGLGLDEDLPWYNAADVADYARIMKGGEDYMISQYDTEIEELEKQEHEDELLFGEDSTWTRKAIAAIKDAKDKLKGIGNPPDPPRQVERRTVQPTVKFEPPTEKAPDMYHFKHAINSGQSSSVDSLSTPVPEAGDNIVSNLKKDEDSITSAISKLEVGSSKVGQSVTGKVDSTSKLTLHPSTRESNGAHPPDQQYYFYQALPHFYLSSLDIRILKTAFGDFSQFPSTILPRVEHISTGHIVDDELRKRAKYLSHLPYGCEVTFLECDWTDLVNPTILDKFAPEVERRRKRNREKAVREEKERIRAEKDDEDKRWATARRKRSSVSIPTEQPFKDSDFQPLSQGGSSSMDPFGVDTGTSTASPPWSPSQGRSNTSFTALESPSNSPPNRRTVWGTTAIESGYPPAGHSEPDPTADDGWLQDWERDLIFEQHDISGNGDNSASTPPAGNGKKKKNKKITLMSTNARRAA